MAIFTYLLYTVIDPGLIAKQLALAEETIGKKRSSCKLAWIPVMAFTEKL